MRYSVSAVGVRSFTTYKVVTMTYKYILPARRHWVSAGWHPPQA